MKPQEKLNKGYAFYREGDKAKAGESFISVVEDKNATNREKLNGILGYLSTVDRLKHKKTEFKLIKKGLDLCKSLKDYSTRSYLYSTKAQFISDSNTYLEHRMADMKISPFFKSFCLIRDEKEFNLLEKQLQKNNNKMSESWGYALDIALKSKNKEVLAHYYQYHGEYLAFSYNRIKTQCITDDKKFNKWPCRDFIMRNGYDRYFIYTSGCRKELINLYKKCNSDFKKSISIFKDLGKIEAEAYCRYNYAIHLKMFGSFRVAKHQCNIALLLSREFSNQELEERVKNLLEKIKLRNKEY